MNFRYLSAWSIRNPIVPIMLFIGLVLVSAVALGRGTGWIPMPGLSFSVGTVITPVVPESAILADPKGNYVYIVGADNRVARRAIKTGLATDDGILILRGLRGDERVVLQGASLSEGEEVRPQLVSANKTGSERP